MEANDRQSLPPEHSLQLSSYCALQRATLLQIAKGTELESHPKGGWDSCGSGGSSYRRTRNGELSPFFRPTLWFCFQNAGFGFQNEGLPFSDPDCPTGERTANAFHLWKWNRVYGRSATPGCRRRPWGDLVVPTGWRRRGRSMDFLSF
uniref:Uncharacterized protein n=1 Tax=Thalassia hemprichii TaxID=55496 RepID=A0A4Y1KCI3_9LILI|nr:hypothetical protein [Thalassia hemprichii]YP_009667427.1 hypothetical protein [Thalassia hemprichii]ATP74964.1 hypothetical protein [Thalassia hemprichii]ATP74984.1 hypothetical protein [Thalassia hemprichii]